MAGCRGLHAVFFETANSNLQLMFAAWQATCCRCTSAVGVILGLKLIHMEDQRMSESETITLGGGCFWCIESAFDNKEGIIAAESGFMGGTVKNPTYEQVVQGDTGHREVVRVSYDPSMISYERLLELFFRQIGT